jgi:hypothetical protein
VTAADDEVELFEVELLDEHRKERQAPAIVVTNAGEILNQGCVNARSLDGGRHRSVHVHQSKELGGGVALAQHF